LISHDLSVLAETCNRVAIMYAGKIVETGLVVDVFSDPKHPYTQGLIAAFPDIRSQRVMPEAIPGDVPSLIAPPTGCVFHPRCKSAFERCSKAEPSLAEIAPDRRAACFLYPEVLEVPDEEVKRFREAASKPDRPDSAKVMDEVRRKYSITWKESIAWRWPEILVLAAMVAAGTLAAFLIPALLVGFVTDPFASSWTTIGFGVAVGVVLGTVASWPPGRPWRRLPIVVGLLSVILVITGGIRTFFFVQLV